MLHSYRKKTVCGSACLRDSTSAHADCTGPAYVHAGPDLYEINSGKVKKKAGIRKQASRMAGMLKQLGMIRARVSGPHFQKVAAQPGIPGEQEEIQVYPEPGEPSG